MAGSHRLNPRYLDSYQGPPQQVSFLSKEEGVNGAALEGLSSMEIIPLAADSHFWGADFLVGYTIREDRAVFAFKCKIIFFCFRERLRFRFRAPMKGIGKRKRKRKRSRNECLLACQLFF